MFLPPARRSLLEILLEAVVRQTDQALADSLTGEDLWEAAAERHLATAAARAATAAAAAVS